MGLQNTHAGTRSRHAADTTPRRDGTLPFKLGGGAPTVSACAKLARFFRPRAQARPGSSAEGRRNRNNFESRRGEEGRGGGEGIAEEGKSGRVEWSGAGASREKGDANA